MSARIVHAIANIGNTAYVGGEFDKIGFYTGGGAAFDAGTGASRSGNAGFRVSGVSGAYPGGIVTAAVAVLLGAPDGVRPELIVCLGHPSPQQPPPVRRRGGPAW